ncbi:MAG: SPOR domain-containing protein [Woeseiaceae bacterium]|nr:SPOR domain-containing protein [Woeseiaceae bacterium]
MDTHIKERLVGAIVLILTMVAVVPLFLDGQDILTTEKSLISDNQKKDKDRQIITLNLDRNTPIPINDNRNESIYIKKFNNLFNQSRNRIKSLIFDDKGIISNQLNNEVISDNGVWVIQLGSFLESANAQKKVKVLKEQGYSAYFVENNNDNKTTFKVWLGPQRSKQKAEDISVLLSKDGHENRVVPY